MATTYSLTVFASISGIFRGIEKYRQTLLSLIVHLCSSQWTLERTIGNLDEDPKQPSNPYANLANHELWRSQIAALHAMLPDLDPDSPSLLRGAVDLGDGYIPLRAWDEHECILKGKQAEALHAFTILKSGPRLPDDWEPRCTCWACLRLPNLQVARCAWKETECASAAERVRCSWNVKVS